MDYPDNSKLCAKFKSLERGLANGYVNLHSVNCNDCVYFSSRNCGMDAASCVEPQAAMFL